MLLIAPPGNPVGIGNRGTPEERNERRLARIGRNAQRRRERALDTVWRACDAGGLARVVKQLVRDATEAEEPRDRALAAKVLHGYLAPYLTASTTASAGATVVVQVVQLTDAERQAKHAALRAALAQP